MSAFIDRRGAILAGLLLASHPFSAQDWVVYDLMNSPLPSTTVTAIADAPDGIWIGTDWGLCHFDGVDQWVVYQESENGLPSNGISCLAADENGGLWVGTAGAGLVHFHDGIWTTYSPLNSEFPEYGVRDLFIDTQGWVWATTSGALVCFTGSEWRLYDDTEDSYGGAILNTGNTNTVAVRDDGLICLGTFNGGLHYINGSVVDYFTVFEDGFFDNTATDVLFDPLTGDRWVATPAAGLLRQQGPPVGGNWFQWNSSIAFPSNAIECIAMDGSRRVWAGTQISGVIRVDQDGSYVQFTTSNSGLPDNEVGTVHVADDGALWVGTVYGGVARYQPDVGVSLIDQVDIAVFPNPVSTGSVQVVTSLKGFDWELLDACGKQVVTGQHHVGPLFIPLDGLDKGVFLLNVRSGEFNEVFRLLVV